MPKRKRSDHDSEEYIRRKLRKLERKLNRRRKVRAGSSHSSTSSVNYQPSPVPSHHQDVNLEKTPDSEEVIELIETQPIPEPQAEPQGESSSGQNKLADVPDVQPSPSDVTLLPIDAVEPEIDEEIMMLLGEAPSKDKKYGPDIQKDIAIRWEHISTSGLPKEARKELLEKHLTPDNCKKIEAPLLNPEIKAALSEALLKKDKAIENKQKQYSAAISCIGQALTLLLSSEHKDPQIIKLMIEAGRIMCDSQFSESMARRGFIGSMIRKELRDQLYDTEIDKYLYGEKLSETLKAAKAINKSATDMKLPTKASAPKNKQTAPSKNSRPQYPNSRPPAAPRRAEPPSAQYPAPPRRRAPLPPPQPRYQPRVVMGNANNQARFQQKQMQEREMKIASLYEAQQARALDRVRHSPSNIGAGASPPHRDTPVAVAHQPGKVRQMFEERRTKAGIDKSYPLQPIHNTDKATVRKPLPNGYSKVTTGTKLGVERKTSKMHISSTTHSIKRQQHKTENIVNGSGDLNHNHEPDLNTVKQKLPRSNGELIHPSNIDEVDRAANNYLIENETFPEALAPATTPRSPDPPVEAKKPLPRIGPAKRISPAKTQQPPIVAPATPRGNHNDHIASENNKARGAMQKAGQSVLSKKLSVTVSNNGGVESGRSSRSRVAGSAGSSSGPGAGAGPVGEPCAICGRRFAPDRLDKHQDICKKSHAKKRKPFDALKHRLAGTEAEPFINKLRKSVNTPSSTKIKPLNSSWRKKHEEFINAIRAAKQVQAHLDAGGKLSDLPPPPPSENPDYVSCPHCGRRFNQAAAERHIPKCASYQFNKPKNGSKRR